MADKRIRLKVLTPSSAVLDQDVDFLVLRTVNGDMGVLPGHEPYAALLSAGVLRAFEGKEQVHVLAVLGGMATVRENQVTVMTAMAAHPDELDQELERMKKARLENARHEHSAEVEIQRVEMALRRSLMKAGLGAYPIIEPEDSGENTEQDNGEQFNEER